MKRALSIVAIATIVALAAAPAQADLIGSEMVIDVLHTGFVPGSTTGIHTYGRTESFFTSLDFELVVSSPADAPGYDNAVSLDFTEFFYGNIFTGTIGQVTLSQIDENVASGSVAVFSGTTNITESAITFEDAFTASWRVDDVMANSPDDPVVTIAWNSVPAPGTMALLGLAGLTSARRRRRSR